MFFYFKAGPVLFLDYLCTNQVIIFFMVRNFFIVLCVMAYIAFVRVLIELKLKIRTWLCEEVVLPSLSHSKSMKLFFLQGLILEVFLYCLADSQMFEAPLFHTDDT